MKFFTFGTAFLLCLTKLSASDCGQRKVPNSLSICIQPDYIQGCVQYQSTNSCSKCQPGYKLSQNGCDALEFTDRLPKILGCLKRSEDDSNSCINCANGFIRKSGKCVQGIKDCEVYVTSQSLSCKSCKSGYTLVLGECRFNNVLGCKRRTGGHACVQCYQPFKLNGNHCEISNCQALNDYGCVTCQCGFYLIKDRSCKKMEDGCLIYERGKCIACLNHYKLKGDHCEIEGCLKYQGNYCNKCKQQYDNQDGICEFKNCVDWINDQCLVCQKGYKNEGGICQKQQQIVCNK